MQVKNSQLYLHTKRLLLRPFTLEDAYDVWRLASSALIADTTSNIPHPYPLAEARKWIAAQAVDREAGTNFPFAITRKEDNELIGAIGIGVESRNNRAEIGYWIGVPFWGQGYATEAAKRIIVFGFEVLELNRIYATYFTRNPASRRVMEKAGMRYEGTLREWIRKADHYEDCGICAILKEDYLRIKTEQPQFFDVEP